MKLRWKALVIAFAMAVALWYGVSGSEKVESILEVRVDYRGLPSGYVVRSGLVNKIEVRVRAPIGIIRTLADRNPIFYMDLSSVKQGENIMQMDGSQLRFRSNVEVMDITPSRINLDIDVTAQKQVPVVGQISGNLPSDIIAQVSFAPSEVTISGPSREIQGVEFLPVPVEVDATTLPGNHESPLRLVLPEGIDATPPNVRQTLHIGVKRKLVSATRDVYVEVPESLGSFIRPDKVKIQLAVPLSLVDGIAGNRTLRAFALLDNFDLGVQNLPVMVNLPPGAELVKVEPERIAVTLEQKKEQTAPARNGRTRP